MHVGVLAGDLDQSMKIYGDLLGFQLFWRVSVSPRTLSWVEVRAPGGEDYVESMLYDRIPRRMRAAPRNTFR
jgi:lactoylglutathione lyase